MKVMKKIAKDRKVIPDPIDDRKFQEWKESGKSGILLGITLNPKKCIGEKVRRIPINVYKQRILKGRMVNQTEKKPGTKDCIILKRIKRVVSQERFAVSQGWPWVVSSCVPFAMLFFFFPAHRSFVPWRCSFLLHASSQEILLGIRLVNPLFYSPHFGNFSTASLLVISAFP